MPARPLPLRPKEPAKRPPGIPDELWNFPRNLAAFANARKLSPAEVAEMAGVSPSTISRWLSYDIEGLPVWGVIALEKGMGLPHGTLTLPPEAFAEAAIRAVRK